MKELCHNGLCVIPSDDYPEIFDTIIIGAGPAGLTAGVYAARRKMKTLMICGDIGGQMRMCNDIQNWTGVTKSTGPELSQEFFAHVKAMDHANHEYDLWVREGKKVVSITGDAVKGFEVTSSKGTVFRTKTIICTSGKRPRTLGIPGEKEAMGNGLSFAATSDAPLYKNKKMAIIGGGNSAMDVALQLAKYTDDITMMTNLDHLIGDGVMMDKILDSESIEVLYEVGTKEIMLDQDGQVCGVKIEQEGVEEILECQGIFEEIGQMPSTEFLADFIKLNDQNEIPVNRKCESSVPGFFAGGDCTDQVHKQVIVAAGEGAVAALEAHEFLMKQNG